MSQAQKDKVIELRGFFVTYRGPSDTVFSYSFEVERGVQISTINAFLNEFKKFIAEEAREFDEEITRLLKEVMQLKKENWEGYKRQLISTIHHIGRGKNVKYVVVLTITTPNIYGYMIYAKNKLYSWIKNNTLVLQSYPQNIYILPENKIKQLMEKQKEANRMLFDANVWYREFYKKVVGQVNEMFKKYHIEYVLPPEPKNIHEIELYVTPIKFSAYEIEKYARLDPMFASTLKKTLETYIQQLTLQVIQKLERYVRKIEKKQRLNRKVAKQYLDNLRQTLVALGIEGLFTEALQELEEGISNPRKFLDKYVNSENWKVIMFERVKTVLDNL